MKLPLSARTDVSDNEHALRKLDRRDIYLKSILFFFAVAVICLNLFVLTRISLLADGNKQNLTGHQQNSDKSHHEIKQYIRCVSLLKFDMTEKDKNNREAVAAALDQCAVVEERKNGGRN